MEDDLVDTLPQAERELPNLLPSGSRATLAPTICPDPNDFGTLSVIEEVKGQHHETSPGYDP